MASEANEIIVVLGHEADQVRTAIGNRRVGLVENTHLPPRAQHFCRRRVCRSACSGEGQIICHADQLLLEAGEVDFLNRALAEAGKGASLFLRLALRRSGPNGPHPGH
jgi:hypothetical protein